MITVVVPTANRPQMLRTALRSIDAQTARECIGCVIVSENSKSPADERPESAAVCSEFPQLPIRYVQRMPALDPKAHGDVLYAEAFELRDRYTAVLHDDDWWCGDHLANALTNLSAHPEASAYWSSAFVVEGEASWISQCWNILAWIAAEYPPLTTVGIVDRAKAAVVCVVGTPAHFSTLVAKSDTLTAAFAEVGREGNLLDNDRLLFVELTKSGPLLINFVPEVFVRQHRTQAQRTFSLRERRRLTADTTRALLQVYKREGIDVIEELRRLYDLCPDQRVKSALIEVLIDEGVDELRRENPAEIGRLLRRHRDARWLTQQLCPPLLWHGASLLKTAMQRRMGNASLGR